MRSVRWKLELQDVLDLTPQLVTVYGPKFERLYANRVALAYFGMSLDEDRVARNRGGRSPRGFSAPEGSLGARDVGSLAFEVETRLHGGGQPTGGFSCVVTRC